MAKIRRKTLEGQLANLTEEYAAVAEQHDAALSDMDRIRLKRKQKLLETEMSQVEAELTSLELSEN